MVKAYYDMFNKYEYNMAPQHRSILVYLKG